MSPHLVIVGIIILRYAIPVVIVALPILWIVRRRGWRMTW